MEISPNSQSLKSCWKQARNTFFIAAAKKNSQNFQFFNISTVELKPIELTANYELYRRLGLLLCEANKFWKQKLNGFFPTILALI